MKSPAEVRDSSKGFLLAAAGTSLLAVNPVIGKFCLDVESGFNAPTFAFLWLSWASLYSLVMLTARRKLRALVLPRREIKVLAVIALMTGAVQWLAWQALVFLDPAFMSFLQRFVPVLVILGGVVCFGERLRRSEVAAMGLMILGGLVSTLAEWRVVAVGVGLAMAAYVIVSVQRLIIKVSVRQVDPMVVNFCRTLGGAISLGCISFLAGAFDFDVGPRRWGLLMLGAFVGPYLGVYLTVAAYRHWELSRATLVMMAQPLITFPLAYVCLGTAPSPWQLGGGGLILLGAFWLTWTHFGASQRTRAAPIRDNSRL